jgi:uncharacterized protein DUF5658
MLKISIAIVAVGFFASPALADDRNPAPIATAATIVATSPADDAQRPLALAPIEDAKRGVLLPPLYGSFLTLQVYDGWTTVLGVKRGATEANPLARGLVGNWPAFWAVKVAGTATAIAVAERLWRHNRRAEAITVMLLSNGIAAAVAARNAAVLRAQR